MSNRFLPCIAGLVLGASLMSVIAAGADPLKDESIPTGKLRVAIGISAAGGAFWRTFAALVLLSLLVGVLWYGTGDMVGPAGAALPFGTAIGRIGLADFSLYGQLFYFAFTGEMKIPAEMKNLRAFFDRMDRISSAIEESDS